MALSYLRGQAVRCVEQCQRTLGKYFALKSILFMNMGVASCIRSEKMRQIDFTSETNSKTSDFIELLSVITNKIINFVIPCHVIDTC